MGFILAVVCVVIGCGALLSIAILDYHADRPQPKHKKR